MWLPVRPGEAGAGTFSSRAALWLAGFTLLSFVYFLPRWNSYNEDARLDVVLSLVNRGVVNIDRYHLNTGDADYYRGHYYSNKAIGQSLLGAPVYGGFKLATSTPPVRSLVNALERNQAWKGALRDAACKPLVPGDHCRFVSSPRLDFALLQYLEAIITVAIPSVLMLLLFFWFLEFFSSSLLSRTILTVALALGTMIFPYSQLFFSHVPATALAFAGFVAVFCLGLRGEARSRLPSWLRDKPWLVATLGGLALGSSVLFEYPALILVVLIGMYGVIRLSRSQLALLALSALPPLLVVMSINALVFQNPFTTGYGCHETVFKGECRGIAGFTWPPDGTAIRDMSVGVYRGLFFLSPFLVLALPGYWAWFRARRDDRMTPLVCLAIPIFFFLAIAMYWGWNGGQVAGPRYLMELVPFLALPVVFVLDAARDRLSRLAIGVLLAASFANVWIETIGGRAFARGPEKNPLFDYALPQLAAGHVPMNLGSFFALSGGFSLLPLLGAAGIWTGVFLVPMFRRVGVAPGTRVPVTESAAEG